MQTPVFKMSSRFLTCQLRGKKAVLSILLFPVFKTTCYDVEKNVKNERKNDCTLVGSERGMHGINNAQMKVCKSDQNPGHREWQ